MSKKKRATIAVDLPASVLRGAVTPFAAAIFRVVATRFASREDLWTGAGARQHGGRWNPPGTFHTVYASSDVQTATAEYFGNYQLFGLEAAIDRTPYLTASAWLHLRTCLDLTERAILNSLGLTRETLVAEGWQFDQEAGRESPTQTLGRLAYEAGIEGLIVPSASRPAGANVVTFPWNLQPPDSYLRPLNPERLPTTRV